MSDKCKGISNKDASKLIAARSVIGFRQGVMFKGRLSQTLVRDANGWDQ